MSTEYTLEFTALIGGEIEKLLSPLEKEGCLTQMEVSIDKMIEASRLHEDEAVGYVMHNEFGGSEGALYKGGKVIEEFIKEPELNIWESKVKDLSSNELKFYIKACHNPRMAGAENAKANLNAKIEELLSKSKNMTVGGIFRQFDLELKDCECFNLDEVNELIEAIEGTACLKLDRIKELALGAENVGAEISALYNAGLIEVPFVFVRSPLNMRDLLEFVIDCLD